LLLLALGGSAVLALRRDRTLLVLAGVSAAAVAGIVLPGRYLTYYPTLLLPQLALFVPPALDGLRRGGPLVRLPAAAALAAAAGIAVLLGLQFVPSGDPPGARLGAEVRLASRPDDRLWVLANRPQIYYFTGLRPAHRYFTPQALFARDGAAEQVLSDLQANPPRFVVATAGDYYPGVLEFLQANYEILATENELLAFVRRD
jgi:hypothetical protein